MMGLENDERGNDMNALTGSEKQIKWATEIRSKFIEVSNIDETTYWKYVDDIDPVFRDDFNFENYQKMISAISGVENASIWIQNFSYVEMDNDFVKSLVDDSELCVDDEGWDDVMHNFKIERKKGDIGLIGKP